MAKKFFNQFTFSFPRFWGTKRGGFIGTEGRVECWKFFENFISSSIIGTVVDLYSVTTSSQFQETIVSGRFAVIVIIDCSFIRLSTGNFPFTISTRWKIPLAPVIRLSLPLSSRNETHKNITFPPLELYWVTYYRTYFAFFAVGHCDIQFIYSHLPVSSFWLPPPTPSLRLPFLFGNCFVTC